VGGFMTPADVAGAAIYFMSDESRAVTGQLLMIDGGWSVSDSTPWSSPEAAG
jgi:enoyl-[acyl-carrier-protein] reductase (NADH)